MSGLPAERRLTGVFHLAGAPDDGDGAGADGGATGAGAAAEGWMVRTICTS